MEQGATIEEGDIISLDEEAKITLYFMDGEIVNLMPKQRLLVGSSSANSKIQDATGQSFALQAGNNSLSQRNVNLTSKNEIDKELSSPASFRGEGVVTLAPAGLVISETPEFSWFDSSATETATEAEYVLIVVDSKNNEVFRGVVKGFTNSIVRYTIPNFKFEINNSKNRYKWDVYPLGKEPKLGAGYDLAGVMILGDSKVFEKVNAELDEVNGNKGLDEKSKLFLSALILKDNKCYSDAISALDKLGSDDTVSQNILRQKAWLYARLGANGSLIVKKIAELLKN